MSRISKRQREYKTLLSVLAHGSTGKARALLIENTGEDADNAIDLERKLAKMYFGSTSKIDIERAFALMHPHKDFILKYVEPKQIAPMQTKLPEGSIPLNAENLIPFKQVELSNPKEATSCGCGCGGSYSNASGGGSSNSGANNLNQSVVIIGLVSVVAMVSVIGVILYLKSNK